MATNPNCLPLLLPLEIYYHNTVDDEGTLLVVLADSSEPVGSVDLILLITTI